MDKQQPHHQIHNEGPVSGQIGISYGPVSMHLGSSSTPPPVSSQRVAWNIPYQRNDRFFTGREEILTKLRADFEVGNAQRYAISGLGGVGKTQIAVEYAYRYDKDYQAVLWAHAESHEALIGSFVEIAGWLDLPEKDEQNQTSTVNAVKRWLQDNNGWLLLLDKADNPAIVDKFLPTKFNGHILLTTRRAQIRGSWPNLIEVETFTPKLGALFLLRRVRSIENNDALEQATRQDREAAVQISEELGGLPLALNQAGAYVEATECTLPEYLNRYGTHRIAMFKRHKDIADDYPKPKAETSVATTWSLSFKQVKESNAAAADLLRLCAFLASDDIPEEIVFEGASYLGDHLRNVLENKELFDEAIAVLRAYSLIRRRNMEKMLNVHRLVQAIFRDAMPDDEMKQWAERAVCAVNAAFPQVGFATWKQCGRCLPHALACAKEIEQRHIVLPDAILLLCRVGSYLGARARYSEAERWLQSARDICEQHLERDHHLMAMILGDLGVLYQAQGKYKQAEQWYKRALDICKKQLGPAHPDTATSLNNLAEIYQAQGKYKQAEQWYKRAFNICKQRLGSAHPDTAISLNNLADFYYIQSKYEQAEPLYKDALAICEQELGLDHHLTATIRGNLGVLYQAQGKYEQAEPLLQFALAIHKNLSGSEHPNTANSLNNLAKLYYSQEKYEQAEPLYKDALGIYEKHLEPEHPVGATIRGNLGMLYQAQDKYEQAEPLLQRALAVHEKQLGPKHLNTANSLNNLAKLYYSQEKYEQAEPLYKRALAIWEQQLGSDHPNTATSLNDLIKLYQAQGK